MVYAVHLIYTESLNLVGWEGYIARMEESRSAFKILTGRLIKRDF